MTVNNRINNSNEGIADKINDVILSSQPNILWVGCGDLFKKCIRALETMRVNCSATISGIDIRDRDELDYFPQGHEYYNIKLAEERSRLRRMVSERSFTHVYIANWPEMHLLSALKYAESCDQGVIIIAKPLDTNFELIETVAKDIFPEFTRKIFVHDHYRNKGGIQPMYDVFPQLISAYGRVTRFRAFLVEPRLIEDEKRLDALECGVIFDLASHLFSLLQLFFLPKTSPGVQDPIIKGKRPILGVSLRINHVVRARYRKCELSNSDAETFAAIDTTLEITYRDRYGKSQKRPIEGLLVVGKGITAEQEVADSVEVKAFELTLEGFIASLNFRRNSLNPDLQAFLKKRTDENGYNTPLVESLSKRRSDLNNAQGTIIPPLMTFAEACENSKYLRESLYMGKASRLLHYSPRATLSEVLNLCCSEGGLAERWRPRGGFTHLF
jgi:hypothetical protein